MASNVWHDVFLQLKTNIYHCISQCNRAHLRVEHWACVPLHPRDTWAVPPGPSQGECKNARFHHRQNNKTERLTKMPSTMILDGHDLLTPGQQASTHRHMIVATLHTSTWHTDDIRIIHRFIITLLLDGHDLYWQLKTYFLPHVPHWSTFLLFQ